MFSIVSQKKRSCSINVSSVASLDEVRCASTHVGTPSNLRPSNILQGKQRRQRMRVAVDWRAFPDRADWLKPRSNADWPFLLTSSPHSLPRFLSSCMDQCAISPQSARHESTQVALCVDHVHDRILRRFCTYLTLQWTRGGASWPKKQRSFSLLSNGCTCTLSWTYALCV